MPHRHTIREQMDACRPDSDDLHLPEHAADLADLSAALRDGGEFRAQWEKHQHESRVVRSAIQDVSVPAGLEARLLAAVHAAESAPSLAGVEQAAQVVAPAAEAAAVSAKAAPPQPSRRRLVFGGPLAAAALVLLGIFLVQNGKKHEPPADRDQLASEMQEWLPKLNAQNVKASTKPIRLPPSVAATVTGPVTGTGSLSTNQGTISVYQLRGRGTTAYLLVLPTTKSYPVNVSPYSKVLVSGGWRVGAWQTGGVLYVIVTKAELDEFVRQSQIG